MVLALGILLFIDVLAYRSVGKDFEQASWVTHTEQVIALAEDIQSDLVDSETAARGFIITGNASFVEPHTLIRDAVRTKIKQLIEITSDNPQQLPGLRELQTLAEKKLGLSERMIRLQMIGLHEDAVGLVRSGKEKAVMDRIREAISAIDANERVLLAERLDKASKAFSFTRWVIVLSMSLLVFSFVLISRTKVALHESDKLMRMLIENVPNYAIFLLDTGGRILNWNVGAERLKGYRPEEIIGQHFSRFYPEEDILNGKPAEELEEALAKGRADDEGWQVRKDGARFWASVITMPVRNESGELRGFAKITRDMTDYKKVEDEILQLNANLERQVEKRTIELQATNNELEAFSYSVSHDLRAPLRSIDGFSQALLEDYAGSLDDQAKGYLSRVRAATQRMGLLIDDMLTLSRVTRVEMRREIVDLGALAAEVLAELQQNEPERKVVWHIDSGMTAVGDPHLLRVMLFNLLGNAWKFTGKTANARIEFGAAHNDNGAMEYFVRDNGAGFDMTYAGKLFNAFQRLHRADEFHGTGIGLATVKRIIHRHGGQVRGAGVSGKGATFYFTLPG